jgi:hypothetical protein
MYLFNATSYVRKYQITEDGWNKQKSKFIMPFQAIGREFVLLETSVVIHHDFSY